MTGGPVLGADPRHAQQRWGEHPRVRPILVRARSDEAAGRESSPGRLLRVPDGVAALRALYRRKTRFGGEWADIQFAFTRTKTVAELKHSVIRLTNGKVVERFGLQKVSYDVTNVRYGILMVLDLRDLGGGQPHVSEPVSVHHLTPAWGSVEHAVVLFRV